MKHFALVLVLALTLLDLQTALGEPTFKEMILKVDRKEGLSCTLLESGQREWHLWGNSGNQLNLFYGLYKNQESPNDNKSIIDASKPTSGVCNIPFKNLTDYELEQYEDFFGMRVHNNSLALVTTAVTDVRGQNPTIYTSIEFVTEGCMIKRDTNGDPVSPPTLLCIFHSESSSGQTYAPGKINGMIPYFTEHQRKILSGMENLLFQDFFVTYRGRDIAQVSVNIKPDAKFVSDK